MQAFSPDHGVEERDAGVLRVDEPPRAIILRPAVLIVALNFTHDLAAECAPDAAVVAPFLLNLEAIEVELGKSDAELQVSA